MLKIKEIQALFGSAVHFFLYRPICGIARSKHMTFMKFLLAHSRKNCFEITSRPFHPAMPTLRKKYLLSVAAFAVYIFA